MSNTINAGQFPTTDFQLTDFLVKTLADGTLEKNTVGELAQVIQTVGEVGFKGYALSTDTPSEDGWYFASENGTYTNFNSEVVDLTNGISILIVQDTQTNFKQIVIPSMQVENGVVKDSVKLVTSGDTYSFVKSVHNVLDSETAPFKDKIVQSISGYINGNEMIDISGNNYNLDIIDNDIELTKGLPYKSNAKLAQKSANFGTIPDVNNFWFQADGTPNQIPVASFFQNIDFANQIYCKHKEQLTDGLGYEIQEPCVVDITTYSSALTDIEQITAVHYFGVPEVATNKKYVGIGGSDANDGLSYATRWLTVDKAETSATAGDTIYVSTGDYSGDMNISKNLNWIATGFVNKKAGAETRALQIGGNEEIYLEGFNFDVDGKTNNVVGVIGTGVKTFERCNFTGTADNIANSSNIRVYASLPINYYNCNFSAIVPHASYSLLKTRSTFTMKGCIISGSSGRGAIQSTTAQLVDVATIEYCKFTNTLTSLYHSIYLPTTDWCTELNIRFNYFKEKINGSVRVEGQPIVNVERNFFKVPKTLANFSGACSVLVEGKTGTSCLASVSYNEVESKQLENHCIKIGSETSNSDNDTVLATIIGNKIKGAWYYNQNSSGAIHQIFVGHQLNPEIKYNQLIGCGLGIVLKHSLGTYTANDVSNNVLLDNSVGILVKGINGANLYSNTILNNEVDGTPIKTEHISPSFITSNLTLKNNILANKVSQKTLTVANGDEVGLDSDYNVYYGVGGALINYLGADETLADFKIAGFETNGVEQLPKFRNPDDFKLWLKAPIENAVDLGSPLNKALDVETDFPNKIIIREQYTTWQNGAYVLEE